MRSATLKWARLAPLPASAQGFTVRKEGAMFNRPFRASFKAPLTDVDRWLRESPGTQALSPETPTPASRRFFITPGGGANHAEVTVDDDQGFVTIYVYWS